MGIVEQILKFFGLKKSGTSNVSMAKLRSAKAENESKLEELKDRMRNLSARARDKKREHDADSNKRMKQILLGELNRILDELDTLKSQDAILGRNLNVIALAIAKYHEHEVAQKQGVSETDTDDLAIELEDVFAELQETDRAAAALERVKYEPEVAEKPEMETRMADVETDTGPTEEIEVENVEEDKAMRRMKELDIEM